MNRNKKVFVEYLFSGLNFELFKKINTWKWIILLASIFVIASTDYDTRQKLLIYALTLFAIAGLELYKLYKTGEHIGWDRRRLGILSNSQRKYIKKEVKMETVQEEKTEETSEEKSTDAAEEKSEDTEEEKSEDEAPVDTDEESTTDSEDSKE